MGILDLAHGLHRNVAEAHYHERVLGLASKHALDLVARSPAHYRAWLASIERAEREALAFGKAFHCALLEPERFAAAYLVEPTFGDCRFKENKANRDAWRKDNACARCGRYPGQDKPACDACPGLLEQSAHLACRGMADSIRRHRLASRLLVDGDAEVTLRWKDEPTGLECKARADFYVKRHAFALDVKTTENASPDAFPRDAARYGYGRQAAFYGDGFAAIDEAIEHFLFLVVEKAPPYAVAVYALDEDSIARGRASVRRDLEALADAFERDDWRAYSENIVTIGLPGWAA